MTLGIASCVKFWYSPKAPDTRNNAEHLQRTCKKLLNRRTSKKLAENLQRTSKKLARNARNLQRTSKNPPNQTQNHRRHIACFDATATNAELQNQGAAVLAPLGAFGSDNAVSCRLGAPGTPMECSNVVFVFIDVALVVIAL